MLSKDEVANTCDEFAHNAPFYAAKVGIFCYLFQNQLNFRQGRHEIPASVALAIAFVAGALLLPFLEDETVFQCETGTRREAFHRFDRLRVFVVFLQHALQLEVGSAAGFDVIEMVLELGEDVLGKDGVVHERLQ